MIKQPFQTQQKEAFQTQQKELINSYKTNYFVWGKMYAKAILQVV